MNTTVIARQQDARGTGHESERVLVHVHTMVRAIPAGDVVPHGIPVGPEPNFEGVEKDAVGVVRINGDALVVPVLGIVSRRATAVRERIAGRASDLSPGYPAVCGAVGTELAASRTATATIRVTPDGLHLGIDIVRIAWRYSEINATELIAGGGVDIGRPARRIEPCPAIIVRCNWGKIRWAAARWQSPCVDAVRPILIEVGLHRGGESAHADRGNNARAAAGVDQSETGNILAHRVETVRCAGAGPVSPAIIRKVEARFRASHDVAAVPRVDPHFADRLVLWKYAGRKWQAGIKHICSQQRPGNAGVGRLENALTAHREGTKIQVACAGVDRVVIVWVNGDGVDANGGKERIVRDGTP